LELALRRCNVLPDFSIEEERLRKGDESHLHDKKGIFYSSSYHESVALIT